MVKSSRRATAAAKADIIVHREAVERLRREGGDPADKVAVLGSFELQFGQYQGSTFKWLLENDLGYATYIVNSLVCERRSDKPLSTSKFNFKNYIELFKEGRNALQLKARKDTEQQKALAKALATPVASTAAPSASAVCRPRTVQKPFSTISKPPPGNFNHIFIFLHAFHMYALNIHSCKRFRLIKIFQLNYPPFFPRNFINYFAFNSVEIYSTSNEKYSAVSVYMYFFIYTYLSI